MNCVAVLRPKRTDYLSNKMHRFLAILIVLAVLPVSSNAQELLCKEVKSKGEGHWPIPEKAFTKKRYDKAVACGITNVDEVALLNELSDKEHAVADYTTIENEMIYIEGFFLKLYAESGDKEMKKQFCEFIQNKAYVRH